VPEQDAFVKLIINQVPPFLGAWMLIGIAAASMSTADGAILAMGTVWANNIVRQLEPWFLRIANDDNLLLSARISTFPFTLAATLIGAYYKRGAGYLLIVRVFFCDERLFFVSFLLCRGAKTRCCFVVFCQQQQKYFRLRSMSFWRPR
jgi:Na+/proline symporter